jgi:imidazolonepropionase-like amidohydrolase
MSLPARLAGAAVLVAVLAPPSAAQRPAVAPTTWAITGARLEPVSGPAIAKGTIVIRNGLIVAIGADLPAPADARLIDGTGMTVYPGLIDAYTSLGMPSAGGGGAGGGGGGAASSRPAAPNSNYDTGLQAELRAVDLLAPSSASFTAARGAGFTAALSAQASGVYRGSSALIALRDGPVNVLVLIEPVAQHLGFSRGGGGGGFGGGGFPGSLMGVFAQLRQELLDARHYGELTAAYARAPKGMNRPPHDPTLEALQPVLAGTMRVVMVANSEREIRRALAFAKEFGLSPVIAGGSEAWKAADALAAAKVPVLLDIDFPRRTAASGAAGAGGRGGGGGGRGGAASDSTPESMRVLRERVERPKGAGKLASAGVTLAITAGDDYTDFVANLRRAVAGGLDADAALRALTIGPATLFGVADRLGSLEPGKIANLTVVTGDLFAEDGKVSQLFIDGERYEIPVTETPRASARTP